MKQNDNDSEGFEAKKVECSKILTLYIYLVQDLQVHEYVTHSMIERICLDESLQCDQ